MTAPTRRGAFVGLAALALPVAAARATGPAPALRSYKVVWRDPIPPESDGPHPDAALFAACGRITEAKAAYGVVLAEYRGLKIAYPETIAWEERLADLDGAVLDAMEEAIEKPAATLDGVFAKARAYYGAVVKDEDGAIRVAEAKADAELAFSASIIEDLVRLADRPGGAA